MDNYTRIKGDKARRYISESGNIISRRQYMRIVQGVIPERKAAERWNRGVRNKMYKYNLLVADFRRNNPGEKVRGRNATLFKQTIAALKSEDNSASGDKALALERLGRRSREWQDYDIGVGETPD